MLKVDFYKKYWLQLNLDDICIYGCGWAEYEGFLLNTEALIKKIAEIDTLEIQNFINFANKLEGNFTLLISNNYQHFIISDKMRFFQLVYYIDGKTLVVTDDIMKHKKHTKFQFNISDTICEQFLRSFYVVGPYTLFNDVFSTQSGEIIYVNSNDLEIKRTQYFQWAPIIEDEMVQRDYKEEAVKQDEIFINVFNRMIKSAPHVNNWIIPLSGGYDSRTIVNYLYKLGVKNVICFSYGMERNIQSEISRQVAEALNYEWYFIDFKNWIPKLDLNMLNDYIEFGFNGVNIPHLQDFPAIFAMKELGILKPNDIFVPGHALEVIAGNHLSEKMKYCTNIESVFPTISHHFCGFGYHEESKSKIIEHVKTIISKYHLKETQIAECFDWQERQTKFIANSVKVYEYFGYESRIPEWDGDLCGYWAPIGFNYKIQRNMFKEVFKQYLNVDEIKGIPFANDLIAKSKPSLSQRILNNIPVSIKKFLKKNGVTKSFYYADEGLHLVYSKNSETIEDYLKSYNSPDTVKNYLSSYPKLQKLSNFDINAVSTLLNIRNVSKY